MRLVHLEPWSQGSYNQNSCVLTLAGRHHLRSGVKGAWSEEFKLYSIGRESCKTGIVCRHAYKEDPRLRTPAPLSPDPIVSSGDWPNQRNWIWGQVSWLHRQHIRVGSCSINRAWPVKSEITLASALNIGRGLTKLQAASTKLQASSGKLQAWQDLKDIVGCI